MYCTSVDAVVRKSDLGRSKGRDRPKLTLGAVVRKGVGLFVVREHDAINIAQCR